MFYSSTSSLRTINLDTGVSLTQTTSPFSNSANALAVNDEAGLVYYGDNTRLYYWDPVEGSGAAAHHLLDDLSVSPIQAPVTNINSAGGSYFNGVYYVASETDAGYLDGIYALTLSADGKSITSAASVNLLGACACTAQQLGGFGDFTVVNEGAAGVIYASSTDLSGTGAGTNAGRWRLDIASGVWTLLSTDPIGQMASDSAGNIYTNINQQIRTMDKLTGVVSSTTIATTPVAIYDMTAAFYFDFGDAPGSYGTAIHALPGGQASQNYLGLAAPDNDAATLNASNGGIDGEGDDSTGINDEDALASINGINTDSSSYSATLVCSGTAFVAGWIDFNQNGVFDTAERNANHPQNCSFGAVTLDWTISGSVPAGDSYARFRTATDAQQLQQPTGLAADGEVEDYRYTVAPPVVSSCPVGSVARRYTASDLPKSIGPDEGTTTSVISVVESASLTDVNVLNINGTHTRMRDLVFSLSKGSTTVELFGPRCGRQDNFDMGFDDAASTTPPCPPVDGLLHLPDESLAAFNGALSDGNWTLSVLDRNRRQGGQLQGWELELCADFSIPLPTVVISGQVFDDRNVDGVLDSGDVGIPEVSVVLHDISGNTCESVSTNGDGSYLFDQVAAGNYRLYESAAAITPVPNTCPPLPIDPSGYLSLSPGIIDIVVQQNDIAGQNFADVNEPSFYANSQQSSEPGTTVWHQHVFVASADGTVNFSAAGQVASPGIAGWTDTLVIDQNCNGQIEPGEEAASTQLSVNSEERVCLIDKVFVPANAPPGSVYTAAITALFTFADPSGLLHGLETTLVLNNRTLANRQAKGQLRLEKLVSNLSQSGMQGTVNAALPGDVIRYTLRFENTGTGDILDLSINDTTPAYTQLSQALDCTVVGADAPSGCSVVAPGLAQNGAGYAGPLEWRFSGRLRPGAIAELEFDVTVE